MTATASLQHERARPPGSRFRDVDLSATVFDGVSLRGATFRNVALTGATFSDVDMSHVAIDRADLTGMRIDGVLVADLFRAWSAQRGSGADDASAAPGG